MGRKKKYEMEMLLAWRCPYCFYMWLESFEEKGKNNICPYCEKEMIVAGE